MSCTRHVYTPARPDGNSTAGGPRPPVGPAPRRPSWPVLALALVASAGALGAASTRAEELIRVQAPEGKEPLELRLEDYVAGVVGGEMPGSFPKEALKAQAVAARSYALTRKIEAQAAGRAYDIGAGVLAQVFSRDPGPAARAAAEATAGEVLAVNQEPVEAYFHAACGGRTEGGLAALGRDLGYLRSVACGRCDHAPKVRWSVRLSPRELGKAAGLGAARSARIVSRTPTGRAERVEIAAGDRKVVLPASDLRQRLGFSRLPSLAFELRQERGDFVFDGRGQGHGAGLCQWGAAGLAREGKTYREILGHYYPGVEVVRMY
jgi:stage II sporulation protein D